MTEIITVSHPLSNYLRAILNNCAFFVQRSLSRDCALCGAGEEYEGLCGPCRASLPHHGGPCCPVCAIPTPDGAVCGRCLSHPRAFQQTLAAFTYRFPVDALIQALKYGGNLALAEILAEPLVRRAAALPRPDMLIPVPLFPARLRQRGFNQSLEIARIMARKLDIPLSPQVCSRIRDTAPQASLRLKERGGNVRGAFACDVDLGGRKVAVVDDVMTSGASLDELSKVLRRQGAEEVSAWVVARALPERQ